MIYQGGALYKICTGILKILEFLGWNDVGSVFRLYCAQLQDKTQKSEEDYDWFLALNTQRRTIATTAIQLF
jgi:hypothetical protein